jgi:hypothetical protein
MRPSRACCALGLAGILGSLCFRPPGIWAAGHYLPLHAISDPSWLPPETRRVKQTFAAQ